MQKGDIARLNFGFNEQLIIQRDDLHEVAARLNYAADGIHHHLLNDAAHRRGDHSSVHPVFKGFYAGLRFAQICTSFVQLGQRIALEATTAFPDFILNLFNF